MPEPNQQTLFAPDFGLSPYLARQEVMKKMVKGALAESNGFWLLTAPTGSGKTRICADVAVEILSEGWDKNGCLEWFGKRKKKGIKHLVIVVPERNNRNGFAESLKRSLSVAGLDALASRVLVIPSLVDDAERAVKQAGATCPLQCGNPRTREEIGGLWATLVEAVRHKESVHKIQNRNDFSPSDRKKLIDGARSEVGEAERKLRYSVKRHLNGKAGVASRGSGDWIVGLEMVWQPARIPKDGTVIITTPQKLLNPVDLVGAGSGPSMVNMTSATFARTCAFILDEVDHQKEDWLGSLIEGSIKVDYYELLRLLYDRLISASGVISPLLKGDGEAWIRQAEAAAKKKGSYACKLRKEKGEKALRALAFKAAGRVAGSYEDWERAVRNAYDDVGAKLILKTSEEVKGKGDGRLVFDSRDLNVELGKGESKRFEPLRLSPLKDRGVNLIEAGVPRQERRSDSLRFVLSRVKGAVVDVTCCHLLLCAKERAALLDGAAGEDDMSSLSTVIDGLRVNSEHGTFRRLCVAKRESWSSRRRKEVRPADDPTVYGRGVSYIAMEDSDDHALSTRAYTDAVMELPEAVLRRIGEVASVVGLSATAKAPTICNWDIEYMEECGVLRAFPADDEAELLRLTRAANKRERERARIEVKFVEGCSAAVEVGRLEAEGSVRPDELMGRALESWRSIGMGERFASAGVRGVQEIARRYGQESDKKDGWRFRAERLWRAGCAIAAWASKVAAGKGLAGLVITTVSYVNDNAAERKAISELFDAASRNCGLRKEVGEPYYLNSAEYSSRLRGWRDVEESLGKDIPVLVFMPNASGGFAKDFCYKKPAGLRAVDAGYGYRSDKIDFDFIYCDRRTHCLKSGRSKGEEWGAHALKMVVQEAQLEQRGETPSEKRLTRVRAGLSAPEGKSAVKTNDLPSFRAKAASDVGQVMGRCCRTPNKWAETLVMLDAQIADEADFGWFAGEPVCPTLEAVLESVSARKVGRGGSPDVADRARNKAALANRSFRARHLRTLKNLTSKDRDMGAVAAFDRERAEALEFFCGPSSRLSGPCANQALYMVDTVEECMGYAYAELDDFREVWIELPRKGDVGTEDAAARLRNAIASEPGWSGARVGVVSAEAARLPELLAIPSVKAIFDERGYQTEFPPSRFFLSPYAFQCVYLGALGEVTGEAFFAEAFGGEYSLARGRLDYIEDVGDFEIMGPDGSSTLWWLDDKHYDLGAYLAHGKAVLKDDVSRYERKVVGRDVKGIIVANVLDEQMAAPYSAARLGGAGEILSVPRLFRDGFVDPGAAREIRNAIES